VRKCSGGRSKMEAVRKAEGLFYNYSIRNDTLHLDEYFSIPPGSKWAGDNVHIDLYLPEGTVLHFDKTSEYLLHFSAYKNSRDVKHVNPWEIGNKYWVMSESGLKETDQAQKK
jgi:hypothetical protein